MTTTFPEDEDGDPAQLRHRIEQLERHVRSLTAPLSMLVHPLGASVFMIADGTSGTSRTWQQLAPDGSSLSPFVDGNQGGGTNGTPLIEPGTNSAVVQVVGQTGVAFVRIPKSPDVLPALLLASSTNAAGGSNLGAYTWAEQQEEDDGTLNTKAGGRGGSGTNNLAIEPNGARGLAPSTVVYLQEHRDKDTGRLVYGIVGENKFVTGPATVLAASGTDADTKTWESHGTNAATLTVLTRTEDDGGATPTFYLFVRDLTIDAGGNVRSISAEERVTLFSTGTQCASTP